LGQGSDDGSGGHLARYCCAASRARREYSLNTSIRTQDREDQHCRSVSHKPCSIRIRLRVMVAREDHLELLFGVVKALL
jgi:hypothetical protein